MLRKLATACAIVVTATTLALVSVWWMVFHGPTPRGIVIGPWRTSQLTGSSDAGMYVRAHVAITGLFALNSTEAVYFEAARDDAGQPLRARCTYVVEGKPVAARWWSITAYADDNFLIPNPQNRFSFNMGNLKSDTGGTFKVLAAPKEQAGNWLPTGSGEGGFNLLFRIYNPDLEIVTNPRAVKLPSIILVGACE